MSGFGDTYFSTDRHRLTRSASLQNGPIPAYRGSAHGLVVSAFPGTGWIG